jgi:glyoxylase-like metal-dependent hydrolase (beta-lactamase superfamily II)
MTDIRSFSVGPIQENAYLVRASSSAQAAVLVDPGEEPQRLLDAAAALNARIEAILLTHCHFDHIGAVAPIARATGTPVYCPRLEAPLLEDVMRFVPPGFGPFESHRPEHTLQGDEHLTLAGLDIEVLFTPGHSPGHLTYAIVPSSTPADWPAPEGEPPALLSGDVLFNGSVGRVDLPGGDWPTLERSIADLMERFPAQSTVYPGHMGITTLGSELQSNPFLTELRAGAMAAVPAQRERQAS